MLTMLLLAAIFALINYIRGRGMFPGGQHFVASVLWAFAAGAAAALIGYTPAYVSAIMIATFIGMFFWVVWGWGLYFSARHGIWAERESEVNWIDSIGKKLVPWKAVDDIERNRLRGTICMSLRGLYIWPLFWLLSAPSLGLVGLVMGPIYRALAVEWAEPLTGAMIGAAVGYVLERGF